MNMFKDEAVDTMEQSASEMKKSGQDWLHYIQTHPIQSILFGIVGLYAIKGMLK